VDPKLKVDMKNNRHNDRRNDRGGRADEMAWKQRQHEQMRWEQQLRFREEELRRWEHEEFMRRSSEDRYWTRPDRNRMHELEYYEWERREKYVEPQSLFPRPGGPPPQNPDDRLVMSKHTEIYPNESELKQVQSMVAAAEKALKLVSDNLEEEKKAKTEVKKEDESSTSKPESKSNNANRILKGVMRVGALAKGLLLQGQLSVELVVLCAEKPTYTLLKKIGKLVPEKLKEVSPEEKYNMSISIVECAIFINSTTEPKCSVKVALTSPSMREGDEDEKKEKTPAKGSCKPSRIVRRYHPCRARVVPSRTSI
jgi:zinc finger RNA-binding protein